MNHFPPMRLSKVLMILSFIRETDMRRLGMGLSVICIWFVFQGWIQMRSNSFWELRLAPQNVAGTGLKGSRKHLQKNNHTHHQSCLDVWIFRGCWSILSHSDCQPLLYCWILLGFLLQRRFFWGVHIMVSTVVSFQSQGQRRPFYTANWSKPTPVPSQDVVWEGYRHPQTCDG